MPVVTKTVSDAVAQMRGYELRIHRQEVHMVLLAGIVEGLVKQAYFTESNASAEKFVAGRYGAVAGNIRVWLRRWQGSTVPGPSPSLAASAGPGDGSEGPGDGRSLPVI